MKRALFFLLSVLFGAASSYAVNDLSIRQDVAHPTVIPGYIDEATIVVEPYGGYSMQSLYIKYSDHGLLGGKDVITHSFELPEGAIVNDLWLWIGDSVMQAKILERKHAQGLWDTITALKSDPALLKVDGKQFTLSVYPLTSGSFRKVKIQMLVPTAFAGKQPLVSLPYKFLAADKNTATPVKLLFRTGNTAWGTPAIVENPQAVFAFTLDTMGKQYKGVIIPDLKKYAGLTVTCADKLTNGWTAEYFKTAAGMYYSFGMYEPDFFNPIFTAGSTKKSFVGLDLSGFYGMNATDLVAKVSAFLSAYLHSGDSLKIAIAGEGLIDTFPAQGWYTVTTGTVSAIQSAIGASRVLSAKALVQTPRIFFSDGGDGGDLKFSGVDKLAAITVGNSFFNNITSLNQYNIVTTYWQGLNEILTNSQLDAEQKALDTFFMKGGIFVEFYAYNRDNMNIARRYFKGLVTPPEFIKSMLHRNSNGPIGHGFPESFYYENSAPLNHADPDAINELYNDKNEPVVISKKIGNGRFVLSSLWHMQDNLGIKKALCTAELNLQNQSKYFQLSDVLKKMATTYGNDGLTEAVIMSNSDCLITKDNLTSSVDQPSLNVSYEVPHVKTIDLLDGVDYIPPVYTVSGEDFYGSSYCLRAISDKTGGAYFSRHTATWDYIVGQASPANNYFHDSFTLSVKANGVDVPDSLYNSAPSVLYYDNVRFYSGKAPSADSLTFSSTVKYHDLSAPLSRTVTRYTGNAGSLDSTLKTIYQMEILKCMLRAASFDTNAIVNFAVKNRFLTDVTAFIALEPNDTTHFLKNPKDESGISMTAVDAAQKVLLQEQFLLTPLFSGTQIMFMIKVPMAGMITMKIFDLSGREIARQNKSITAGTAEYFTYQRLLFAKGMYIAIAQYVPAGGKEGVGAQRRIERFMIK